MRVKALSPVTQVQLSVSSARDQLAELVTARSYRKSRPGSWTRANKGIGFEIGAGLGRLGFSVGVGARDEQRRRDAVAKLQASGIEAFGVPLDVTDDASVNAAAGLIEGRAAGSTCWSTTPA